MLRYQIAICRFWSSVCLVNQKQQKRTKRKEADHLIFDLSSFMGSFPSDKPTWISLLNATKLHTHTHILSLLTL